MRNTYTKILAKELSQILTKELSQILTEVARAKHQTEALLREPFITGHTKNYISVSFLNRLQAIERDMISVLGDDAKETVKAAVMSIDASLRTEVVHTSFQALSEENKCKVEEILSAMLQEQYNLPKE